MRKECSTLSRFSSAINDINIVRIFRGYFDIFLLMILLHILHGCGGAALVDSTQINITFDTESEIFNKIENCMKKYGDSKNIESKVFIESGYRYTITLRGESENLALKVKNSRENLKLFVIVARDISRPSRVYAEVIVLLAEKATWPTGKNPNLPDTHYIQFSDADAPLLAALVKEISAELYRCLLSPRKFEAVKTTPVLVVPDFTNPPLANLEP